MYRTDLGILFLIWFAVHALVCVSACEPLISTKHMLLNTGKQQPVNSALLPACQRERKVCVDMCECVKCVFAHIKERFALG